MNSDAVREILRQRAIELGFDDCRFTTATAPAHAAEFQKWIGEKNHGEMTWLERNAHKRIDPQQVLVGAKTIICLAVSYHHFPEFEIPKSEATTSNGLVARYARFPDYHDILAGRLKEFTAFLDSVGRIAPRAPGSEPIADGARGATRPTPGTASSLWYVDTGPLLERDLAQRAGLGFVGKHTNLISRKLGNWIFLAEIITTLEVEPDAPETNRCGSCSRCITACPTAAITAPFQLDARKCISYLTIELKGSIPVELRSAIGNRIYGCDDCLAACPWNRFARQGRMMKDQHRPELTAPDLIELLSLDEVAFKQRFAGSPILRTKRRGLLRNVCVALGNFGDSGSLPALEKAALDSEPLIAEHARWAIEQVLRRTTAATTT